MCVFLCVVCVFVCLCVVIHTYDNRRFTFVKLNEMEGMEPNKILDTIAVVKSFEDCATINTR